MYVYIRGVLRVKKNIIYHVYPELNICTKNKNMITLTIKLPRFVRDPVEYKLLLVFLFGSQMISSQFTFQDMAAKSASNL